MKAMLIKTYGEAEYIAADAHLIAHKPKKLSMREAAALPLVAITAYEGLARAGIKKGQKVVVHGGSGGVGHVALQLAKHFGADVYSTGGGEKSLALIQQLGATAINYKTENVEQYAGKYTDGAGFDLVFDSVRRKNLVSLTKSIFIRINNNIAPTDQANMPLVTTIAGHGIGEREFLTAGVVAEG